MIVEFVGFGDTDIAGDHVVATSPTYMLVKLLHNPGFTISLPGLPPNVIPIQPVTLTYSKPQGCNVTMEQLPVTLVYSITDYKCQGKTFNSIICNIKRPRGSGSGFTPSTSAYVQLSCATTLNQVSIVRPFDDDELRQPLDTDLLEELAWQEHMVEVTAHKYGQDS